LVVVVVAVGTTEGRKEGRTSIKERRREGR
jgi:hypothetical protein